MAPYSSILFCSDIHIGWTPLIPSQRIMLPRLFELARGVELLILNGDIIDAHRGQPHPEARRLRREFEQGVLDLQQSGVEVIYLEGNHDRQEELRGPLTPTDWCFELETTIGQRVRVFHGHRFNPAPWSPGPYEAVGTPALRFENGCYAYLPPLRWAYPHTVGRVIGFIGSQEDAWWRRLIHDHIQSLNGAGVDVVVHGHLHFGPGQVRVGSVQTYKSGAWAGAGHVGSVNRFLLFRDGAFERITLEGERWVSVTDGT